MKDYETKEITYFNKVGSQNTHKAIECAIKRLKEGDIKTVLVASSSGETAVKLAETMKGLNVKIIAVTLVAKYEVINTPGFSVEKEKKEKNFKKLKELGIPILQTSHALSGIERSVKARWGTAGPVLFIADTLRLVSDGLKVGVEITVMAADSGLILFDENIMTIAGSRSGADTVMVVKPAGMNNFFDLYIKEIICKPVERVIHEAR